AAGWSPDDKALLAVHNESNFNQNLYVLDVADGKERHLTPHPGNVQYHSPSWSADGKAVYCSSTAGGRDLAGLAQIDVATGKLTSLDSAKPEVGGVVASPGGRWLAWRLNVGGKSELRLRDLKAGKTVSMPGMPLGVIHQIEFARDDSKLVLAFDGPRHNSDVWVWDLPGGKPRQLQVSS